MKGTPKPQLSTSDPASSWSGVQFDLGVNYLHYGDALETLSQYALPSSERSWERARLLSHLSASGVPLRRTMLDVVRGHGSRRSKTVDVGDFAADIEKSLRFREAFRSLGCRGFSYRVITDFDLCDSLADDVSIRVGLMADECLFYPDAVRTRLRRVRRNHVFERGWPALALALGKKNCAGWFVVVLQSDVAHHGAAMVREHLRGWRKVLMATVLGLAQKERAAVYLARSMDVLRSCHPQWAPARLPGLWRCIYDGTAAFFGMESARLPTPMNIQIMKDLPPVFAEVFYKSRYLGGLT